MGVGFLFIMICNVWAYEPGVYDEMEKHGLEF